MTEEKTNIYPSPASTEIYIELNIIDNKIENVSIYNQLGVLVKYIPSLVVAEGKAVIGISDLSEGLYYITAKKDNITLKGQFIKIK